MSADRHNSFKLKTELLPPEWELELSRVLHQGSIKYSSHNWLKGMPYSNCVGALKRHLLKYLLGEKYDKETGCHHLAHVAWNALVIFSYDLRGIGENDLRPLNPTWPESSAHQVDNIPEFKPIGVKHV